MKQQLIDWLAHLVFRKSQTGNAALRSLSFVSENYKDLEKRVNSHEAVMAILQKHLEQQIHTQDKAIADLQTQLNNFREEKIELMKQVSAVQSLSLETAQRIDSLDSPAVQINSFTDL